MIIGKATEKPRKNKGGNIMCKTCGCGHDHEHDHEHEEMELETMFLTLEDDTELECGILGVFEVEGMKGKEFIALLPLEDETVLLYEYQENGDDVELSVIEDDDDFEKVSNTFYDLFDGEDEE
jgi:uncharacterized protein YrzB (UPF0473 family)